MKYKIIVTLEAEGDLKEAFAWYEDKRTGLGYDFLLQVDVGINFINRNSEIHRKETCYQKIPVQNHLSCGGRKNNNPRCNSWQEET